MTPMRKDSFLYRVYDLYADGFRSMRLGRTLWAIILPHQIKQQRI